MQCPTTVIRCTLYISKCAIKSFSTSTNRSQLSQWETLFKFFSCHSVSGLTRFFFLGHTGNRMTRKFFLGHEDLVMQSILVAMFAMYTIEMLPNILEGCACSEARSAI